MLGGCWELWVTGWIGREVGILWWTWLPSLAEHTDVLHLSQSSNRVVHALLAPASQLGWQPERQWINHVTWVVIDWSRIAQSYSDRCINTRGVPLITYRWHLLIYFIYITACAYNIHMIEWEYNYVAIYRQLYKSTKALILIIIITCEWELIKKKSTVNAQDSIYTLDKIGLVLYPHLHSHFVLQLLQLLPWVNTQANTQIALMITWPMFI